MGQKYLIDTNAVIDFVAGRLPEEGNVLLRELIRAKPCISVINKIELLGFLEVPATLQEFVEASEVVPLNDYVVDQTVGLRMHHRLKLPDAVIAASAMVTGRVLLTRNTKDFAGIAGLRVQNPHEL